MGVEPQESQRQQWMSAAIAATVKNGTTGLQLVPISNAGQAAPASAASVTNILATAAALAILGWAIPHTGPSRRSCCQTLD